MNEITSYIENCRKKGFSDRYIKKVLKDAGHQEFVVRRAFSMSKRKGSNVSSRNFLYSIFIIIGIVALLSVIFMINSNNDSAPTGQVIQPVPIIQDQTTNDELIKTKNLIIAQQTDMINNLDLSVEEKNALITKQTSKINKLFNNSEMQRKEMVKASLELANSILER